MLNGCLPMFVTDRLVLQGVTADDFLSYEKHFVDYEVINHLSAVVPWPYPKNGVADFLTKFVFPHQGKTQWMWGIFEKSNSKEIIGVVHLWREGRPEHRGFWLGKPFWGKGYMSEAVIPVMDYAFNNLSFETLVFANAVGNLKSRRIKEKTGAKLIDVKPAKFVNPEYTEHEVWELKKHEWKQRANYLRISSAKSDIDLDTVHGWLKDAYWCKGIPKDILKRAMDSSICIGAYQGNQQVGFARIVTDSATFAWLCDVYVDKQHRSQGISKHLMNFLFESPKLKGLRRICLATKDAHSLYQKYGFKVTETPQNWMEIKDNDIYLKK